MSESMKQMTPDEVWQSFLGEEAGTVFRQAMMLLNLVPIEALEQGIDRINRELSIGPMINPTAYLGGKRFDNAREYIETISLALRLRGFMETQRRKVGESK